MSARVGVEMTYTWYCAECCDGADNLDEDDAESLAQEHNEEHHSVVDLTAERLANGNLDGHEGSST